MKFLRRVGTTKWGHAVNEYLCACGVAFSAVVNNVMSGNTKSCGCLRKEVVAATGRKNRRHGESRQTAEYRTWMGMKIRCYYPNTNGYENYGGRGIKVCERWLNSFESFLADMGRRPSTSHSIDRVNVNGNYEPKNCRWATDKQQRRNRRCSLP